MSLYSVSQYPCAYQYLPTDSLPSALTDKILKIKEPQLRLISMKITERSLAYFPSERAPNREQLFEKISEFVHIFFSRISLFLNFRMCLMYERGGLEKIEFIPFNESLSLFKEETKRSQRTITFEVMKRQSRDLSQVVFCITAGERFGEFSKTIFTLNEVQAKL